MVKPRQAVAFASWLCTQNGPLLFGADANTPLSDALDFADTRTHWHTGRRRLRGEPGDDLDCLNFIDPAVAGLYERRSARASTTTSAPSRGDEKRHTGL